MQPEEEKTRFIKVNCPECNKELKVSFKASKACEYPCYKDVAYCEDDCCGCQAKFYYEVRMIPRAKVFKLVEVEKKDEADR
jgi:hypothetical protein